jgi:hypothetical protein
MTLGDFSQFVSHVFFEVSNHQLGHKKTYLGCGDSMISRDASFINFMCWPLPPSCNARPHASPASNTQRPSLRALLLSYPRRLPQVAIPPRAVASQHDGRNERDLDRISSPRKPLDVRRGSVPELGLW